MDRRAMVLLMVAVAIVGAPGPSVGAQAPAAVDCATQVPQYPPKGAAEGATFRGRVIAADIRSEHLAVYRLDVGTAFAGTFDETVTVAIRCVEGLQLKVGGRYLISSSRWRSTDGRIRRVVFEEDAAAGWRIYPDRSVRLLRYGVPPDEVPAYLSRPDRLQEAVRAVTD